jgi:hypothetical protein
VPYDSILRFYFAKKITSYKRLLGDNKKAEGKGQTAKDKRVEKSKARAKK